MASTSEDKPESEEYKFQYIRGLPLSRWHKTELIEEICDFTPCDDDLLIATYPKTGSTWMMCIVLLIISKCESFPSSLEALTEACPMLETTGVKVLKTLTTKPRMYRYHLPYNMLKKNPKLKVIYVYRRPDDTFVSYFHLMREMNISVEFDSFFDEFLSDKKPYGSYFDHIRLFLEFKDIGNILLVSYEKLQRHRKKEYLRIAKFIGMDYYDLLKNDESLLDKIIEQTSFDYMKKNILMACPSNPEDFYDKKEDSNKPKRNAVNFFRKGVVGDGKTYLSKSQLGRLMDVAKVKLRGTSVLEEWIQEGI